MHNSVYPQPVAPSGHRSLKDEFALAPFTDEEKARLSALTDKGGIVAHIIKTYVVDTSEYKSGFRKGEKMSGFRNGTPPFDQHAPAKILKYLSDPDHHRYHRCWEDLYRPSATLFLRAELPSLWRMLIEVPAPTDAVERPELLRALCLNAHSFSVKPGDVELFYEVWPGPRINELPSLLPLCLKRDEAAMQRQIVARLEREVADLQERVTRLPLGLGSAQPATPTDERTAELVSGEVEALETRLSARLDQLTAAIESATARTEQTAKQADSRIVGLATELHEQAKHVSDRLREHSSNVQRTFTTQLEKRNEGLTEELATLSAAVREHDLRLSKAEAAAQAPQPRAPIAGGLSSVRSTVVADPAELRQALNANFKAYEVAPACATRVHAALTAQLLTIVTGAPAFFALAACSQAACGGRLATISVTPNTTEFGDLLARHVEFSGSALPLSEFLSQVRDLDGPVLLVLEGVNRAPTESYLLPLLLFRRLGKSLEGFTPNPSSASEQPIHWPRNLWLAATAIQGPTTLPLSREVLAYSVVLEARASVSDPVAAPAPSEVAVEGDLCKPVLDRCVGLDDLDEAFADARAVVPSMRRFARHFARFETDATKLTLAVVEAIAAPLAASLDDDEDRQAAVEALQKFVGPHSESVADLVRRLRRVVA